MEKSLFNSAFIRPFAWAPIHKKLCLGSYLTIRMKFIEFRDDGITLLYRILFAISKSLVKVKLIRLLSVPSQY